MQAPCLLCPSTPAARTVAFVADGPEFALGVLVAHLSLCARCADAIARDDADFVVRAGAAVRAVLLLAVAGLPDHPSCRPDWPATERLGRHVPDWLDFGT